MTRFITILIVVLALGAGVFAAARSLNLFGETGESVAEGVEVRRGPLRINVIESGNLEAADSEVLKSELEGSSTILYLIEEGTHVEPGDLLVELDTTSLRERSVSQEIALQGAEAEAVKSRQELEIQKSQNQSDIAAGERALEFAKKDLKKYREGDWPQALQGAEDEILLSEEEQKRAEDKLRWSTDLEADGFLTRSELEADQLAFKRANIKVAESRRELELLREYDHPRQLEALSADVDEAERELARVKLQATARLVDDESDLRTAEARLGLEREKYDKLRQQIEKARIVAPISGMVVYAREGGGRWGRGEPIQEGTSVRERQALVTIPSAESMTVETSLHESVLEQVQIGQRVEISVDALPDRMFHGRVKSKALLPDQNSWFANPDLRVYKTEIEVLDHDLAMRPGMSCSVDIVVADIDDAVHVPVQSIFLDAGRPVTFVSNGGRVDVRAVQVGRHNDAWVEILDGLSAGEFVLLSQPSGYQLDSAISTEEAEAGGADDEGGRPPTDSGPSGRPEAGAGDAAPASGRRQKDGEGSGRPSAYGKSVEGADAAQPKVEAEPSVVVPAAAGAQAGQ